MLAHRHPERGAARLCRMLSLAVVIAAARCTRADAGAAQTARNATDGGFRGGPAHTGRYATRGVEQLGGLLWRVQTDGPVRSSPTVAGDLVLVGSGDGHLHALDRRTGASRWRFRADGAVTSTPAYAGDALYFTTLGGSAYALSRGDGALRWRVALGGDAALAWGRESGDVFASSPVVHDGIVIVGGGDGTVRALDASTGAERWRHATEGRVRSSPAIADGMVYVGSFDGGVYALDVRTGARRWRFDTEGRSLRSADFGFDRRSIQASPAVSGGTVYVGSRDANFYAIDARTGAERWRIAHDGGSWSIASPAIGDGVIFDASSDARFVHALRASDGRELWRLTTDGTVWSSPALVDGTLYVGDGSGAVRAIDAATGRERWKYRTGATIHSSPVVADGVLFVGSNDGAVYALRAGEGAGLTRAVYWDSASARVARNADHARVRDALVERGYELVDSAGLARWLAARARAAPSVIVFAVDHAPSDVVAASRAAPLRRYLDGGGKVVWLGTPPRMWLPDTAGRRSYAGIDPAAPATLLGVDFGAAQFDRLGARVTTAGERWGLRGWWLASWSIRPDSTLTVLATDERGLAAAWVKSFGGPPGTGFVQLDRTRWRDEEIGQLAAVAEMRPQ